MDEHSSQQNEQKKTGFDGLLEKAYRPGPLIVFFILAVSGLLYLGYSLLTEAPPPPPEVIIEEAVQPAPIPVVPKAEPKVYEEASSEMEDWVKQADLSIIETLRELELPMNELDLVDVDLRRLNGRGYHYQVLQLPQVSDRQHFLVTLRKNLYQRLPDAVLLDNGDNEAAIEINQLPTHRLLLEAKPRILAKPEFKGPKLAVVIDDIGENFKVLKGLVGLDIPLTFAVWPHATHTRESVDLIGQKRRDLIVHFPMEPMGYPEVKPGDDALFVAMNADAIRQLVSDNLARIPEAIGVNNHMGSRFTSHTPGMKTALAEFKRHGLFFLDSLTSSKSVGRKVAKSVAIPFYERDTFIDNVKDVTAIVHQLKKAERVAQGKGYAIAIGHPYPETMAAIRQWNVTRSDAVKVVSLSEITPE